MKFETKAIHVGQTPDKTTGAVIPPISQSTTFAQSEPGKPIGDFDYSRSGNPTRLALEQAAASLENAKFGLAFGSGLAATMGIMYLLKKGDHIISGDDVYGGTFRLFDKILKQYGVTYSLVDTTDLENIKEVIQENTKMIWIETPTNPLLKISDIKEVGKIAKKHKLTLVVDNTFMSPYFQNPLHLGADIVLHSTTKYINGHSDAVGGLVITNTARFYNKIKFYQNAAGAVPGPMDNYLTLRGLKTLAVRMKEHEANALAVAKLLAKHSKVKHVYYPGLASHKQFVLAKKQMTGFGGMVSFDINGGARKAKSFLKKLKVFTLAESLGGIESLAEHPAIMTHSSIPKKIREANGISDSLIRLSVGIENKKDILDDIQQAL